MIAGLIEHPQADVYTRPDVRERVAAYFAAEEMEAVEGHLFATAPPAAAPPAAAPPEPPKG